MHTIIQTVLSSVPLASSFSPLRIYGVTITEPEEDINCRDCHACVTVLCSPLLLCRWVHFAHSFAKVSVIISTSHLTHRPVNRLG